MAAALTILIVQIALRPVPASATLRDLGATAMTAPTISLEPGQFAYTRSTGTVVRVQESLAGAGSWSYAVTVVREVWMANDGSGRIVEHYKRPSFLTAVDRASWRAAGAPPVDLSPSKLPLSPGALTTTPLADLPTEPTRLASLIEPGELTRGGTLGLIAELLGESPASGELRAALFEVAARLPGLGWSGDVIDPLGRAGLGVTLRTRGLAVALAFDPVSSSLLSLTTGRIGPDGQLVAGLTSLTYTERGVVDSVRARP